jgi:type II secretory pathway pseudopilin PulG
MINDNGIQNFFNMMRRFKIKNPELLPARTRYGKASRTPNSELLVRSKGFTLIEIIVLIVMAGILLPVIVVPFVTGVKGSGKPERVTTAMFLAHQRMEYLMKYDYNNLALNPQDFPGWTPITIGGIVYQWQVEVHYVDSNFNVLGNGIAAANDRRYKRIRVQVSDPDNSIYDLYSVVTSFP